MPELPEVQTIVDDLNKTVRGLKIVDFWTDQKNPIKTAFGLNWRKISEEIKNKKILKARRRAKYIFLDLEGEKTLVIHQKLSGHLLYGKWEFKKGDWQAKEGKALKEDPQNRFIRFILFLNNGEMLALSDLRRFAIIFLANTKELNQLKEIKELGPEPLDKNFNFEKFKEIIKKKRGRIKSILMDQKIIAGIGNIYSDEILWYSGIHPLKRVEKLKEEELRKIYQAIKRVLSLAIKYKGDSFQDYRRLNGELGNYQLIQRAYQMTGEKCAKNDGGIIKRIKIGGRSAHFCPVHQLL